MTVIITLLFNAQPVSVRRYDNDSQKEIILGKWHKHYGPSLKKSLLNGRAEIKEEKIPELTPEQSPFKNSVLVPQYNKIRSFKPNLIYVHRSQRKFT